MHTSFRSTFPSPGGGTATASCDASQITIVLSDVPDIDGHLTAMVRAIDIANMVVSSLGFALGCGYSVELVQVTDENGTPHVYGVQPKDANGTTLGFEETNQVFGLAVQLAGGHPGVRSALRDYTAAIADPYFVAFYCYRAVEAIQASFARQPDGSGWEEMHQALGTNKESIEEILKDHADPLRHGKLAQMKPTTAQQRFEMLDFTGNILTRYLDWVVKQANGDTH